MHSDRVLADGDVVRLDVGGSTNGFASDLGRTIAIGHASDRLREVYDVVERAGRAGMDLVRPGVPCRDIDRAAFAVIDAAGFGDNVLHRTGHGLGRSLHEPPYIVATSDTRLEEGMVFSVEPSIYLPGEFGVRTEEIVVVTADGCERLSALPRELEIVSGGPAS
jgi:D-alanyl-D-alanine dipeptidase